VSQLESYVATRSRPCTHCGLPTTVPTSLDSSHPIFCCNGCKGAYELIHGWGLSDFYSLRDQMTASGAALAAGTQSNYEKYDTQEFLGQSAPQTTPDGFACAELGVHGLHCAACSWLIERALTSQTGMQAARVKLSDHTLKVIYDPERTKLSSVARFLDRLGYQLLPLDRNRENHQRLENRRMLAQIAIAGFLAANAMWIAIALYAGQFSGLAADHKYFFELIGMFLGAAAVFGPGRIFLRGALASLKTRTPHMDLPIALALFVGTVIGLWNAIRGSGDIYFDGLSSLVFLLLIGRWIQFRQQHSAAQSVELMMRVTPRHANLIEQDGSTTTILVDRLNVGDKIRVDAGECVPADGTIFSGTSTLNRSLLTGESSPVSVCSGDAIEAGTINTGSPLVIEVAAYGKSSRIGRVMETVQAAATERTPLVQLADRIGGVFVVVVLLLAVVTFAIWLPKSLGQAVSFSTAMLIVACPCALAMATPLAIAVGIGRAARSQILIREGATLQYLAKPGILWFDKTGTLTEGNLHARLVKGDASVIALAAAVESHCQHPIATAIVQAAAVHTQSLSPVLVGTDPMDCDSSAEQMTVSDVKSLAGGVSGVVDYRSVLIGNLHLMQSSGVQVPQAPKLSARDLAENGESPVFIAVDGMFAGLLALSDPIRPNASDLIRSAKQLGWEIGVISGDLPEIVSRVGGDVGIPLTMCHGGVTPEEKLETIRKSRTQYATVAMVGDGANDAAALAAADVGIAVRGGAEVSLLAAPVFLANNQLMNIARLLKGSKTTMSVIYFNFAISLAYNFVAIGLVLCGLITPLLAAIIMPLSSVTVLGLTFLIPSFTSYKNSAENSEVTT
jgi:P-type Cu2+ transporter